MTYLYLVAYCVYEGKKTPKFCSMPCFFRNDPPGVVELDYLRDKIEQEKYDAKATVVILSLTKISDDTMIKERWNEENDE